MIKEPMTRLERSLTRIIASMERIHLEEYLRYVDDRKKQFKVNFMAGLARGFGAAVGFSILGAVIIAILQRLVTTNIPLIGGFLADIVRMIMNRI
ncbi:MAG: hypothetical protein IJE08_14495 [Clostridia bacterium]|nr:hypothetical protein [Clostridia bacterium]